MSQDVQPLQFFLCILLCEHLFWPSDHAFVFHIRNRLLWKLRPPVRQKSPKLQTLTTETSTAIWLAPRLRRTQHTHWRQIARTAVVSRCRHIKGALLLFIFIACPTILFITLSVPVANKRDTRSIEEAMNEIRAKKRQKREDETVAHTSSSSWVFTVTSTVVCACVCVCLNTHSVSCETKLLKM